MDRKFGSETNSVSEMELEKPIVSDKKKPSFIRWIVVLVVVVFVIFAGLYGISKMTKLNILGLDKNSGDWQAVFLSNGQVYFGQASSMSSNTITVKNIYYLQVTQALQPDGTPVSDQQQGELSLVKLGNELHGPKDEMKINRDHVLFIEDLKNDGKVVKAIEKYLEDQKATVK